VPQAAPAQAAAPTVADAERAPRKSRRRRGGRRIEGAAGATQAGGPVNVQAKPSAASVAAKPGLLTRLGHGIKKLITRAPSSQH
jgi:ATP-dependent RNA helicase RhlB